MILKKVVSYFNPHKFYKHWNKVQRLNHTIHGNIKDINEELDINNDKMKSITLI
jgi:hypothetical protein